jgi:hypothetical protein
MQKRKPLFWFISVFVLAFLVQVWASERDVLSLQNIKSAEESRFMCKNARSPLPPYLSPNKRTRQLTRTANGTGAISGHVTQAEGGTGIEGVRVWADQLACPSYGSSAYSNQDGYYVIDGLPAGNYTVRTTNSLLLVDLYWNDKLSSQDADTVAVISSDTTESIDFSLRVGGKIKGTVTFSEVSFVIASVSAVDTASGNCYRASAVNMMGNSASYEIKNLPTGTYRVRTENVAGFVDVYYDNKSGQSSADPVSVAEGASTSSIDFTLSFGGTIEGNVASSTKGPLGEVTVWACHTSDPEWTSFTATDVIGDYALGGLRGGYWKILALGDTVYAFEWYNNKDRWDNADSVYVIGPGTISGKDFSLEVGGSISGRVYGPDMGPLSGCEVVAYESSSFQRATVAKSDTTSADGSYRIGGLRTGDYYVAAMTECDLTWYDNTAIPEEADLVHVSMPGETSGINFNVPAEFEGEADHADYRPAGFQLCQNYPNPFNPVTEIEYTIRKSGPVTLEIFNVRGQKVATLVDNHQAVGSYHTIWDGKNDQAEKVSSGIYLYRLQVNGVSQTRRMVLLK